jgi:hypothetical protein
MEHDLRKFLAQKISEAEQRPAAWNKAATWQKLHAQLPQAKKHVPYLRYAAILAILTLFCVSLIQVRGTKRKPVTQRVKENAFPKEQAITAPPKVFSQAGHESSPSLPALKKDQHPNTIHKTETQPVAKITPENGQEIAMLPDTSQSPPKDSVIVPQQVQKNTVAATAVTHIEPIIGTYVAEEKAPIVRRKKTRVYILDNRDDNPTEEHYRNAVLARIK